MNKARRATKSSESGRELTLYALPKQGTIMISRPQPEKKFLFFGQYSTNDYLTY
jgi:hypothetical protein